MKEFQYNRVLLLVIFIGLLASLAISLQRHEVESRNMQVDLAIDYEGLVELAEREGLPREQVLREAKEAGITSLAVYETTFKKLNVNGKATAVSGGELQAAYHNGTMTDPAWRELVASGKISGSEVYVTGHHPQTFKEVKEDLFRRLGKDRVRVMTVGTEEVLAVKAHYESFVKMNLGMPTDEMQLVNEAGFFVLARPSNYHACTSEDVNSVFKRMEGIKISEVVFSGSEILGTPKSLQATIDNLKDRDLTVGFIENVTQLQFYKQAGMEEIPKGIGYDHIARLYTIPKDEQPKLKISTAVERWANTDQERNIRIDLLRIYEQPAPGLSLMETNMKYIRDTKELLAKKGYTFGPAGTYEKFYPSKYLRALVMLGVAAAAVLYLSLVVPWLNARPKYQYILLAVCGLMAAVPVLMGSGSKLRVLAAFASANLFPSIAMIWQLDRIRSMGQKTAMALPKLMATAAIALFMTGALSMIGAAYLSGSLSDVEYFLEFNIFRGIKLTFVLPLVLVAIAFLQRFDIFDGQMDDTKGFVAQMKKILDMPVKIKTFLGMLLVLGAGVVFIARSGHTSGMPVSNLEIQFRAFLEQAFYARPRSKELLIGHPAFMLAAMAWHRKWPTMVFFLLVIVATIGQGSMVETFAHMRTPVYMSLVRGIGGMGLGAVVGIIGMVLIQLWQGLFSKIKERSERP